MKAATCARAVVWLAAVLGPVSPGAMAANAASAATAQVVHPAPVTEKRARSLYYLHCAGCHQLDGSGAPAFGVPSMINSLGVFQRTAAGRAFLVQVPGARNAAVTDAELAAITNWQLKAFSSATLPADFKPYTAAEVTEKRHQPVPDVIARRAAILSATAASAAGTTGAQAGDPAQN
jgi:mono/diheme cytochrome c family protein